MPLDVPLDTVEPLRLADAILDRANVNVQGPGRRRTDGEDTQRGELDLAEFFDGALGEHLPLFLKPR